MKFIKWRQLICATLLLTQITGMISFAASSSPDVVKLSQGPYYSSDNVYAAALKLQKTYPWIIEVEVIGKSTDGKPLYVVRLGENIQAQTHEALQRKNNLLITAGLHARETANPVFVMKIIEDYAKDYVNDQHLKAIDVKASLNNTVYHFIPLCNPDGFDLVKYGVRSIKTPSVKDYYLINVAAKDLSIYKANLRGVDLNRNFVNQYYDLKTNTWKDRYLSSTPTQIAYQPSARYYSGIIGEEIETKVLSEYYLKYDFRVYMSYHSQGRIIYSGTSNLGQDFDALAQSYKKVAMNITGYKDANTISEGVSAWGYESGYTGYRAYKPLLTIETLTNDTNPTSAKIYESEYKTHNLNLLPAAVADQALKTSYSTVKLYQNDVYVMDIQNNAYAKALADRYKLQLVSYTGKPIYNFYSEASETITVSNPLPPVASAEASAEVTSAGAVVVAPSVYEPTVITVKIIKGLDGSKYIDLATLPENILSNFSMSGVYQPIEKQKRQCVSYNQFMYWVDNYNKLTMNKK